MVTPHLIIEAGGSLDEANSLLGLARASSKEKRIKRIILQVQKHLFTMGAEFSVSKGRRNSPKKRISEQDVKWLERLVEEFEESLALPPGFVAFGQKEGSSHLDVARTSVRKVERMATKTKSENPFILKYLNRLSDLIFLLACFEEKDMVHFTVLVSNITSLQFNTKVYLINAPTAKGRIKMEFQNKGGIEVYIFSAKAILVFIAGGIVFHLIVMFIDYFLMIHPFYMDLRNNFAGSIFSEPMVPMIGAYGLLSLGIYLLWEKTKKAVLMVREKEFQKENVETVLKSMQRLTGILAEHIASQNSEIMGWIEFRKRSGHPVPPKVANPSEQIAKAIQAMSELSFVIPYTAGRPANACDFESILCDKLSEKTDVQLEKNISSNTKNYQ